MSAFQKLVSLDRILCGQEGLSKKRVLEHISTLLSEDNQLSQLAVFNSLIGREKLGSTGMNDGVALPHGRIKDLIHPILSIITLKDGVDWDALDGEKVDIVIALLVPEEENETHIRIISQIAEFFSIPENILKVRTCKTTESIFEIFKNITTDS